MHLRGAATIERLLSRAATAATIESDAAAEASQPRWQQQRPLSSAATAATIQRLRSSPATAATIERLRNSAGDTT